MRANRPVRPPSPRPVEPRKSARLEGVSKGMKRSPTEGLKPAPKKPVDLFEGVKKGVKAIATVVHNALEHAAHHPESIQVNFKGNQTKGDKC